MFNSGNKAYKQHGQTERQINRQEQWH